MPKVLWLTGLSGSGKTTIAQELYRLIPSYILDGDVVRKGLNKDLGYSSEDRQENIRRVGEVAKILYDAGVTAIVAFISPFEEDRQAARKLIKQGDFIEVYLDCPLEICEQRDEKGLYKKARSGELKEFTGIDSAYEIPVNPEIVLDTNKLSVQECIDRIMEWLIHFS
jgi:adenylyl-sulfate kinase